MYPTDDRDRVVAFGDVPPHSPGAPMPLIVADDVGLLLLYEVAPDGAELVVLKFTRVCAHFFGPPNDEPRQVILWRRGGFCRTARLKSSTRLGSVLWSG